MQNSRRSTVIGLIFITFILGGAAVVIGNQLTQQDTTPDDTSASGCLPGCCGGECGGCPDGQNCDIPNGACSSGMSCNPSSGGFHKACVGDQCVNVAGAGGDECSSHDQCGGGGGGDGGDPCQGHCSNGRQEV